MPVHSASRVYYKSGAVSFKAAQEPLAFLPVHGIGKAFGPKLHTVLDQGFYSSPLKSLLRKKKNLFLFMGFNLLKKSYFSDFKIGLNK